MTVARVFGMRERDLFKHGLHAAAAKASAIELACRYTGLKQYEVSQRFGYSSETSIGKQRKRLVELLRSVQGAEEQFKRAEQELLQGQAG